MGRWRLILGGREFVKIAKELVGDRFELVKYDFGLVFLKEYLLFCVVVKK